MKILIKVCLIIFIISVLIFPGCSYADAGAPDSNDWIGNITNPYEGIVALGFYTYNGTAWVELPSVGVPGEPGIQGVPGENGTQGIQGIQGIQGDPGTPGVVSNFIKLETRIMTAGSGDVSYTGYGFKPEGLIQYGYYAAAGGSCFGAVTATQYWCQLNNAVYNSRFIWFWQAGSVQQVATLKSFDDDGFTLTWVKTGAPKGTGYFIVIAFNN